MLLQDEIPDAAARDAVRWLCEAVQAVGGRALLVGGCVRDMALGHPAQDVDVEVYRIPPDDLLRLLKRRFALDLVGRAFGVIKLRGLPVDVSVPRRERKQGAGHKGFLIDADPSLGVAEAAARRDFTINAISFDPLSGEWVDPCHGRADLKARILRHVSDRFAEDPLRVLRGMQFVARFALQPAPDTVALCRGIAFEDLPRERVFDEWRKLLLQGVRPSLGLRFLEATGWTRYFPELDALIGCPQEPEWHPEGDVWTHTGHVLDAFARERTGDDWEDLVVGLAALCHDLGKPATTRFLDGRIRSPGHERESVEAARAFLDRLTNQRDLVEQVLPLVQHHHRPSDFHRDQVSDAAIRRLAVKVGRLDRLVRVARADAAGRPPLADPDVDTGAWLLERAAALSVQSAAPHPLVRGRDLLALGLAPGPEVGRLLEICYEAQLEGTITTSEDGLAFVRDLLSQRDDTP